MRWAMGWDEKATPQGWLFCVYLWVSWWILLARAKKRERVSGLARFLVPRNLRLRSICRWFGSARSSVKISARSRNDFAFGISLMKSGWLLVKFSASLFMIAGFPHMVAWKICVPIPVLSMNLWLLIRWRCLHVKPSSYSVPAQTSLNPASLYPL